MTESGWLTAVPAALVAVAVLLVPGLLITSPLRLPVVARVALSGAAGITAIGAAGVVFGFAGIPFGWWQPLLVAVVGAGIVWAVARRAPVDLVSRRAEGRRGAGRGAAALAGAWLGAVAVIVVVAFAAVPHPELVSQTYDNVFHLSAIASILDAGDASSLTLRTLIETDRTFAVYPSGWHSLVALVVQLSGASIPVGVNASWIAVCAVLWLPGAAWLAQVLVRRASPTVVACCALPIAAAFGSMPYALLPWGSLYPTMLGTALLPVAIAVPLLAARLWRAARPGTRSRVVVWAAIGVVVAVAAVGLGQPRVLASWVLLLVIPAIAAVVRAGRAEWRRGGARRRRVVRLIWAGAAAVVVVGAAGFAYLVFRLGLFERPLDDRLGGGQAQAVQSIWRGVWQVLSQSALVGIGAKATAPALLLAAAVLIGAVVMWRRPRLRWVVGSYALVALLFVLSAGSDDVVTKLATALWYKDKFRLSSVLPVLGVVLAVQGVIWLAARVSRRRAVVASVASVASWVVAATSALVLVFTGATAGIGDVFRLPAVDAAPQVVSRSQIEFFGRLGQWVPADQRVLGDPWDGSGWTQVFGDREPVFPHVNGQWDADRQTLAWSLADIDTNPAVCAALDRLRVRYVTYSPHVFGGGDPSGNHFPGPHAAVDAGLFTLVADGGDVQLYRIDQCGPLPAAAGS